MDITTLDQFKDEIYGVKGTPRRDNLERELAFKSAMPVRRKK